MTKIYLEEGDAMLVVRKNGEVHAGLDSHDLQSNEPSRAGLLVLGLINCIENESWTDAVVKRMKEKLAEAE